MSGSGYSEISDSTIPDEDEIKKNELESNGWTEHGPKQNVVPVPNDNPESSSVTAPNATSSVHAAPTVDEFEKHKVQTDDVSSAPSKSQIPPFEGATYEPDELVRNGPISQLVAYAEEFIYKTHPNSTALRRHSTALIRPLFSRVATSIKSYSLAIDNSLQQYISKFKKFGTGQAPKADKEEIKANEVLSSACEVWFDFHKEPGYASVFDFQQELQNKLQNVIEPVKTQSSALKDKFTSAKKLTYSGFEFISLHIQIFLLAIVYWLNFRHWETSGVSAVVEKFKNPEQLASNTLHVIRGLPSTLIGEMSWKAIHSRLLGALWTSSKLLGRLLVVTPLAKRQKTMQYYVLILDYTGGHTAINKDTTNVLSYVENVLVQQKL